MIHPRATANVPPAAFPDGRPAAPPRPAQGVSRRSSAARIGAQTTTGGVVVVVADSSAIGSSAAWPDRRLDHRPHSPRSTGRAPPTASRRPACPAALGRPPRAPLPGVSLATPHIPRAAPPQTLATRAQLSKREDRRTAKED